MHTDTDTPTADAADPGAVILRAARAAYVAADDAVRWRSFRTAADRAAAYATRAAAAAAFVRAAVDDGDPEALLDALAEVYYGVVLDEEWIERYSPCAGVVVYLHVEDGKVGVFAEVYDRHGREMGEEWIAKGLAPTDSGRIWDAISEAERGE